MEINHNISPVSSANRQAKGTKYQVQKRKLNLVFDDRIPNSAATTNNVEQ